jgi:hypothetical protein
MHLTYAGSSTVLSCVVDKRNALQLHGWAPIHKVSVQAPAALRDAAVAVVVIQSHARSYFGMHMAIYQDAMACVLRDDHLARYAGIQSDEVTVAVDVDTWHNINKHNAPAQRRQER